jgi:biopolymer transport protein TolR
MIERKKYKSLAEINVTNLVDVTLVLLIIFMITVPLLRSGIEVDLPKMKNNPTLLSQDIIVTCGRNNDLYIDGERVQDQDFEVSLSLKWRINGGQRVLLNGDRELSYGKIIKIMDRMKDAGISQIGLVVDPDIEK